MLSTPRHVGRPLHVVPVFHWPLSSPSFCTPCHPQSHLLAATAPTLPIQRYHVCWAAPHQNSSLCTASSYTADLQHCTWSQTEDGKGSWLRSGVYVPNTIWEDACSHADNTHKYSCLWVWPLWCAWACTSQTDGMTSDAPRCIPGWIWCGAPIMCWSEHAAAFYFSALLYPFFPPRAYCFHLWLENE